MDVREQTGYSGANKVEDEKWNGGTKNEFSLQLDRARGHTNLAANERPSSSWVHIKPELVDEQSSSVYIVSKPTASM